MSADPFNFNQQQAPPPPQPPQPVFNASTGQWELPPAASVPPTAAAPAPFPAADPFAQHAGAAAPPPFAQPPPPAPYGAYQGAPPAGQQQAPAAVNVDEQIAFTPPPQGTHVVRLATCVGDVPTKSNPPKEMVTATFEIVAGDHAGKEIRVWRVLTPTLNNNTKKWNSRGIAEIKADLAAVGSPLPPGFMFPTQGVAAARIYAQGMANKNITVLVTEEVRRPKTGEAPPPPGSTPIKDTRTKIVGLAGAVGAVTPAGGDPFGFK
jgi:hypothetical protein